MNATANILENPPLMAIEEVREEETVSAPGRAGWSPNTFAQQQVRALVQQIFFSGRTTPVRQVVFSGLERATTVSTLCRRVAQDLASQVPGRVCFVEANIHANPPEERASEGDKSGMCRSVSRHQGEKDWTQVSDNLWLVTVNELINESPASLSGAWFRTLLTELRCEFQYAIVHGPPAGLYNEATVLGQICDGMVLVLHAHQTRRVAARKVRNILQAANVSLLGTVLDQRTFPIPEGIYRRL